MNIKKMSTILSIALFIALSILGYIQPASAQRLEGSDGYSATKATASGSLGVAALLNGFYYNYPLFEGKEAPPSTLTVTGYANDDEYFTNYSVNAFDATRNASFVVAPFNSYPAMSTILSQGLTLNISSDKNCVITNVDGYTLTEMPNNVTISVNNLGEVSVNNSILWKAQPGYKVVGYLSDSANASDISEILIEENLSDLTNFIGVDIPSVGSTGSQVAAWTLPSTSLPGNFEEFLGFNLNTSGQLQPMVASYFGDNDQFAPYSTSGSSLTAGVFAPVEVAQVYASDKVVETSVITISNPLNNKTATVTTNFLSSRPSTGFMPFYTRPSRVNEVLGGSQAITVVFQNGYGDPLANQIVYVETGIPGLWITQINGKTITGQVNLGTLSSPSMQTVNTPVPLFNLGAWASAPAYPSVTVTGLTAYHLNNNTTPVVALTSGDDGTVSFTLAAGDVTYVAKTASPTGINSYKVDPGTAISQQYLSLSLYPTEPIRWNYTLLNWAIK